MMGKVLSGEISCTWTDLVQRETTSVTFVYFPGQQNPLRKGSTPKEKNLLLEERISAPDQGSQVQFRDYFPYFLHKNISCDPSLESSRRDDSNEGSQDRNSVRNKRNYL